jgi:hypothetical protein
MNYPSLYDKQRDVALIVTNKVIFDDNVSVLIEFIHWYICIYPNFDWGVEMARNASEKILTGIFRLALIRRVKPYPGLYILTV